MCSNFRGNAAKCSLSLSELSDNLIHNSDSIIGLGKNNYFLKLHVILNKVKIVKQRGILGKNLFVI